MTKENNMLEEIFKKRVDEYLEIIEKLESNCETLNIISEVIAGGFKNKSKVLICGNGGSAADSQHLAAEFISAFSRDINRRALPAIALTVDSSVLTAFSNDFTFEKVFARQVEALGNQGDILIVFTTSGTSRNCLEAVRTARELGLKTIAFSREGGGICREVDFSIEIPSTNTQHIQEAHIFLYHLLVEFVEIKMFRG